MANEFVIWTETVKGSFTADVFEGVASIVPGSIVLVHTQTPEARKLAVDLGG